MAKWSAEKTAQMWELLKDNTQVEAAKVLGVTVQSISQRKYYSTHVKKYIKKPGAENKIKMPCLCCLKDFLSWCKIRNRICVNCKQKEE